MSAEVNMPARCLLRSFAGWAFFFVIFAALYLLTMQTGVGWQDSGSFQSAAFRPWGAVVAEYALHGNLALAHPIYAALTRVAACFEACPIAAVNAVSAICMAAAVANVWLLSFFVFAPRNILASTVAAVLFGLSHMTWWMATIAEVYATSAMLLTLEMLFLSCILRKWDDARLAAAGLSGNTLRGFAYVLLAATTGIHFSTHGFAVLAWPIYAVVFIRHTVRREVAWQTAFLALFAWILALLPLESLLSARASVTSLPEAITNLLVGNAYSQEVILLGQRWRGYFLANMGLFSLNFLTPAWILAAIGIVTARFPSATAFRAILAVHFLFFIRYLVADQATFAIPTLALASLFAAAGAVRIGMSRLALAAAVAVCALTPPVAYGVADKLLHRFQPDMVARAVSTPFRDEISYWVLPWKMNEDSAQRFASEVAETTESDAVICSDATTGNALSAYFHLHPERRGSRTFCSNSGVFDGFAFVPYNALVERYDNRPWYVVRPFPGYVPDDCLLDFKYEPHGTIYRMKRK